MTATLGLEDKENRCSGSKKRESYNASRVRREAEEFLQQEVLSGKRIKCQLSGNEILNKKVGVTSLEWPKKYQ